jgi:hypothetical protein
MGKKQLNMEQKHSYLYVPTLAVCLPPHACVRARRRLSIRTLYESGGAYWYNRRGGLRGVGPRLGFNLRFYLTPVQCKSTLTLVEEPATTAFRRAHPLPPRTPVHRCLRARNGLSLIEVCSVPDEPTERTRTP